MNKIGVVGAGVMGTDIAALFSNAGYSVTLIDISDKALQKAMARIKKESVKLLLNDGQLRNPNLDRNVFCSTQIEDLKECFFVIETIKESLEDKIRVMKEIEKNVPDSTVIGTNTSSYMPKEIAREMSHPERLVLFHFANPPIPRRVIEIAGERADASVINTASHMAQEIDKKPFILKKESRGHVMSRLRAALLVASSLESHFSGANPEEVDVSLKKFGFERGAFELCDMIGLDVVMAVHRNLKEFYGERFNLPKDLETKLEEMVKLGKLGRKTGAGFYRWKNDKPELSTVESKNDVNVMPILTSVINEAFRILQDGIADEETINAISKLGSGTSMGVFDLAGMLGPSNIFELLHKLYSDRSLEFYQPCELLVERSKR
jgi:enoyl-CoA hydratase/3-hydroxyacyl-CoA dehydrogenase